MKRKPRTEKAQRQQDQRRTYRERQALAELRRRVEQRLGLLVNVQRGPLQQAAQVRALVGFARCSQFVCEFAHHSLQRTQLIELQRPVLAPLVATVNRSVPPHWWHFMLLFTGWAGR